MRAGQLSTTDAISIFFCNFVGFFVPQPFSSSFMSRYVLNSKDLQCFQASKLKKCEVDFEDRRMQ